MEQYDLTNPDECGRFAQMLSDVTGGKMHFVLSYAVPDEKGFKNGAITNVEPESACKILLSAVTALSDDDNDYEERTLRDN